MTHILNIQCIMTALEIRGHEKITFWEKNNLNLYLPIYSFKLNTNTN